jgi:hypothetical protein
MLTTFNLRAWENRALRRVIRNIKTGEYFQAGAWTNDALAAQDFPDTRELLATCARYQLKDIELVVQAGYETAGSCDIPVPWPVFDNVVTALAPQPSAG